MVCPIIVHFLVFIKLYIIDYLFVTGHFTDKPEIRGHQRTEIYQISKEKWTNGTNYPEVDLIYSAATINYQSYFYVLGGQTRLFYDTQFTTSTRIMQFDPSTDTWVFIGRLTEGRYDHSAIMIENKIYLIGGQKDLPSEVCTTTVPAMCSAVNNIEYLVKKPKLFGFSVSECNLYPEIPIYEEKNNTNSILVLTQKDSKRVIPSIINMENFFNPHYTSTLFASRKNRKESIVESCSVIHKNKMYVYGGTNSANINARNQILELDCQTKKLEERATLKFAFDQGSCASNNVDIVLCFAKDARKLCYKSIVPAPNSWWESFTQTEESKAGHAETAVAMSEGQFKSVVQ